MTMFTPPGEGVRRSGRRSGARRTAVVLLLAIVLLAGAVAGAWQFLLRDDADADSPTTAEPAACATPAAPAAPAAPVQAVAPAKVPVNVYNATERAGLAASVAGEMRKRKFAVKKVANDPSGRKVAGAAEVRHGPKGEAAARTVAAQLPGAELVLDRRKGGAVDLVLGEKYAKLATPEEAAAALAPKPAAAATPAC